MPPLAPANHVLRLDHRHIYGEDIDALCHQFFSYSGANDQASTQSFVNAAFAAWGADLLPLLTGELTYVQATATDLTSSSGPVAEQTGSVTGGVVSNPLAANSAVIIKKHIARRYRGGHPRNYIPGLSEVDISDVQRLDPTKAAAFLGAYGTFAAALVGHTFGSISILNEVNVSYFSGFTNHTFPSGRVRPIPNPRPGGPIIDIVTGYDVNPKVGSQRRRLLQSS